MMEPITVGTRRMGQCLTVALMVALFPVMAVAEGAESWQGKEPYELSGWGLTKWAGYNQDHAPCVGWLMKAQTEHMQFSKEDHKDPQRDKKAISFVLPKGSPGYKMTVLAIDSTLAGKSRVEVGKLVWEQCEKYRLAGYDEFDDFKDPNPPKLE